MSRQLQCDIVLKSGFSAVGLACRCDNMAQNCQGDLVSELWSRYFDDRLLQQTVVPHRIDRGEFVGVFYDFETDEKGPCSLLIGQRVFDIEDVPQGMMWVKVPSRKYAVFTREIGARDDLAQAWDQAWQEVWMHFGEPGRLCRANDFDVEMHSNPNKIELWMSIK
jgi:predicted transcriptional regulator YdeE